MEKIRNKKLDNLKGILILLVVLCHSLYSTYYYNNVILEKFTLFIYTFHMSFFILISGILHKNNDKDYYIKLLKYFIIYNLSFYLYDYLINKEVTINIIKYSSWFIIDLLLFRFICSKVNNKKLLFIISFILSIILGFYNLEILNINRFFYYLTIYIIGTNINIKKIKYKDKISCFIITLLLFILNLVIVLNNDISFNFLNIGSYSYLSDMILRIIFLINSYFLFKGIYYLIPNKEINILTNLGKYTLVIYILHRIPTLLFNKYLGLSNYYIFFGILFGIGLCLLLGNSYFDKLFKRLIDLIFSKYSICIISIIVIISCFVYKINYINNSNILKKYNIISNNELSNIKDNSVVIGYVGDLILLEDQVKKSYDFDNNKYDFNYMFKYMNKYFNEADYMIGIFEGVSDNSKKYTNGNYSDNKELRFNYPNEFINNIKDNGFDLVNLSQNHLLDQGEKSVYKTIDYMNDTGLDYTGAYKNKKDNVPNIVNIDNISIGVLSYTSFMNYYNEDELINNYSNLTNYIVEEDSKYFKSIKNKVRKDFKYLKDKNVDLIIVMPHYGTQFIHKTDKNQELWNNIFTEFGADIILGDHSHAVQPIEYKNDTLIINSPGNYSNSYIEDDGDLSIMTKIYIDKDSKKVNYCGIIPIITKSNGDGPFTPYPIYDLVKDNELNKLNSNLDNKRINKGLKIILKTTLKEKLNINNLEEEYLLFKDGYKGQEKILELNEVEKESIVYKKLSESNKTCFIGDSITEGSHNGGYPWFSSLQSNFNNKYINISKSGYTTFDIINKFSNKIKKSNCSLFVIAIGTNDIRYNKLDVNDYINNIDKIVKTTNSDNIILISPWITMETDKLIHDNYNEYVKLYNKYTDYLNKYSTDNDYIFVNSNKYILGTLIYDSESKYYVDGIHPNMTYGIDLYGRSILNN